MELEKLLVYHNLNIKETLKRMDIGGERILIIVDKNKTLKGVVTDGDIRRHLLANGKLTDSVFKIFNANPIFADNLCSKESVKQLMLETKINVVPVVDQNKRVVNVWSWEDAFDTKSAYPLIETNVPVVIMSGGKGERLGPFTKIFPKSLIPIGDKPVIEVIMDKFLSQGVKTFYVTLNYKGGMIKNYFDNINKPYEIHFVWEKEFLGTAGSLKLLPSNMPDVFFVSNCDVFVGADYTDLLKFHKENNHLLTAVGSLQHYRIPYGVFEFSKGGKLKKINEKPEYDFTINTGLYVVSKKVLKYIPQKCFDMTDLLKVLLAQKESVGIYPISQNSYVDVGQWEEYKKAAEKLQFLQ
ncbi:MAG: CBS domain-containing protein [Candidatus Omnitrophica bacterium]|nr:CBS domain-containing protein [Candidatus Omnitrophota bacterium]